MKSYIPKDLFDILACPVCKADLRYTASKNSLVCVKCGQKYPINRGIPVLLPKPMASSKK